MCKCVLRACGYVALAMLSLKVGRHLHAGDVGFLAVFTLGALVAEYFLPAVTTRPGRFPGPGVGLVKLAKSHPSARWRTAAFVLVCSLLLAGGLLLILSAAATAGH
jgi:hypothetical protein